MVRLKKKAHIEAAPARVPAHEITATPPRVPGSRRDPKNVRARAAEMVIRIMADTSDNPRREGTEAYKHFEAMRGGITVRQYLSKFPEKDQKVARQWLWNTIRDGYVRTMG